MRLHISMPDDLVAEVDRTVGPRDRGAFIAGAVRPALDEAMRSTALDAALGAIDGAHDWDDDPAAWVRRQRSVARRTG